MQRRHAGFGPTGGGKNNCDLVKKKKETENLLSLLLIIPSSLSSLYQSLSVSLQPRRSRPPLSRSAIRSGEAQDGGIFALFSRPCVTSFPAICRAHIYQGGDISRYGGQRSTLDIILLLMAHRVTGPLIPLETTAQTTA